MATRMMPIKHGQTEGQGTHAGRFGIILTNLSVASCWSPAPMVATAKKYRPMSENIFIKKQMWGVTEKERYDN